MKHIILNKLKELIHSNGHISGVSTYCSKDQQRLINVPILKPLLVIIINGSKIVGTQPELSCHAGDFIFFTHTQSISIRNIPANSNYFALLIEFEPADFNHIIHTATPKIEAFTVGKVSDVFYQCILQFIECTTWAPQEIVTSRRIEMINLLIHLGYKNITCNASYKETMNKVIDIIRHHRHGKIGINEICKQIGMSESALYRKLKLEGETVQKIKEKVLMGEALHLLQTTTLSIDHIAGIIGYSSAARFSQRFESHFGLTPKALKKTMNNH